MITGHDIPDQATLRLRRPARTLDEFLAFLRAIEALFGPIERKAGPTVGDRFLL